MEQPRNKGIKPVEHKKEQERCILVGIATPKIRPWLAGEQLAELGRLAETAGAFVTRSFLQRVQNFSPATLIGEGKVNEVNGASVIVSGDAVLKKSGLCRVKAFDKGTKLEPGTVIVTSGEGGLFPDGIPIGTIVSVDYSNPTEITATLRPFCNIGELEDVFVMIPFNADDKKEGVPGASESSAPVAGGQG